MGWSYGRDAGKVEDAWQAGCRAQTGSSNTFVNDKGERYFYEATRKDQPGGAICGTVWKYTGEQSPEGNDLVRKAGTFRINGDGSIERAPATLKKFAEKVTAELDKKRKERAPSPFVRPVAW